MEVQLQGEDLSLASNSSGQYYGRPEPYVYDEEAVDRIFALRKMETSYSFQTFLQLQLQSPSTTGSSGGTSSLSDSWRSKVTQWAFNVVDHFGLSREVVAVSMGIFDRYLATRATTSGNMVLLTSLTTLHLAIKFHETKRVKSGVLANLSRGQFDTAHIEEMELKILSALSWKIYAPTPLSFLSEFLHFLPQELVSAVERKEVYEISKYLAELAVCEASFVGRPNSVVALAAIANVMEAMTFERFSQDDKEEYLETLSELMGQTFSSQSICETRDRLRVMFAKVSEAESFEAAASAQTAYHKSPHAGSRVVSPSGSPSSATSNKTYSTIGGSTDHRLYGKYQDVTSTRTNFWYTPSPPHSRSGVTSKVAIAGFRSHV